jgi:hypothetical protein
MRVLGYILTMALLLIPVSGFTQQLQESLPGQQQQQQAPQQPVKLRFSGQLSSWINLTSGNELPLWSGGRYIPQVNLNKYLKNSHLFDAEFSANIYGTAGVRPFDSLNASGRIKPYRAWVRYSGDQFEFRVGLQKLNFGSASMLRPLMWFDQMDPRDPLQLTDGVWGGLARYYFLNNTNIWAWMLYGNGNPRGWDPIPSNAVIPEFGGRLQLPVARGEIGLTYHHRTADSRESIILVPAIEKIPENKFGFDAKWDLTTGIWVEASYTRKEHDMGLMTNQLVANAGIDYTFGLGNGLYVACEQLLASYDRTPFAFEATALFSVLTANYGIGLSDRISTILYYDWKGGNVYSFLNWQRQYDNIVLYAMAYWNPERFELPTQTRGQNIFAGRGIQIMFVFNH